MTKAMRNSDAKHKDFGALIGIIPTNPKFLPSDIDMVYERNQCFLFGEWKRSGESLGGGQRILLRRLAQQPRTLVLIIVGDTDDGMNVQEIYYINPSEKEPVLLGQGFEDLKEIITDWYENANRVGR